MVPADADPFLWYTTVDCSRREVLLAKNLKSGYASLSQPGPSNIMWRCWQDRVPYDDSKYIESLKRDHTELYARVIAFHSASTSA